MLQNLLKFDDKVNNIAGVSNILDLVVCQGHKSQSSASNAIQI